MTGLARPAVLRAALAVTLATGGVLCLLGLLFAAWLSGTNLGAGNSDLGTGELAAYGAGLLASALVPAVGVRLLLGPGPGGILLGAALVLVGGLGLVLLGL